MRNFRGCDAEDYVLVIPAGLTSRVEHAGYDAPAPPGQCYRPGTRSSEWRKGLTKIAPSNAFTSYKRDEWPRLASQVFRQDELCVVLLDIET